MTDWVSRRMYRKPEFYKPTSLQLPNVAYGDSASVRCSDPSQPCYAHNKDVLRGRRSLYEIQDLVVSYLTYDEFRETTSGAGIEQTLDSGFNKSLESNDINNYEPSVLATNSATARPYKDRGSFAIASYYEVGSNGNRGVFVQTHPETPQQNRGIHIDLDQRLYMDDLHDLFFSSAHGDFAGDNQEDIVYAVQENVFAVAAANYPDFGLRSGPVFSLPGNPDGSRHKIISVAVGHFGAGTPMRVAVLSTSGKSFGSPEDHVTLLDLDPKTLQFKVFSTLVIDVGDNKVSSLTMAAGQFSTTSYDQLVVVFTYASSGFQSLAPIDFDSSGDYALKTRYDLASDGRQYALARHGKLRTYW